MLLIQDRPPLKEATLNTQSRAPASSRPHARPPRIQVAGVSTLDEALFCGSVGVDSVGLTLGLPNGPHDGLTETKARAIAQGLGTDTQAVVITYIEKAREAADLMKYVGAHVVQFHAGMKETELRTFRELCPYVKTIACVNVTDESALERASQFFGPLWDALILDSADPQSGKRGATGKVHDWSISAKIVEQSPLPVILAGGLNPENVGQAI
jgi:phosphoribosylanthranilate isomerase